LQGNIKFSPNRLFTVLASGLTLEKCVFDPSNGIFTSFVTTSALSPYGYYDVEVSPNSSYVFCKAIQSTNSIDVFNSATLSLNGTIITNQWFYSMQLAPDDKIYLFRPWNNYSCRIELPNQGATSPFTEINNFLPNLTSVDGHNTYIARIFNNDENAINLTASNNGVLCSGGSLTLSANSGFSSYSWVGPTGPLSSTLNHVTIS